MGYGIAGAIGAAAATGRPAVAVVGDGGLNIGATELLTAVRERLDLLVVVFVDNAFGLIRLQQLGRTGHESGVVIPAPDLGALTRAVGARHGVVDDVAAAAGMSGHALTAGGVTVVDVRVEDSPALPGCAGAAGGGDGVDAAGLRGSRASQVAARVAIADPVRALPSPGAPGRPACTSAAEDRTVAAGTK